MTLTIERTKDASAARARQATRKSCFGTGEALLGRDDMPPVMKNPPVGRNLTNAECLEILRWLKADLADAAKEAGLR